MPITFSNPPPSALEAASSGMRSIVAAGRLGDAALRATSPDALTLDHPVRVFVMGADDLTAGKRLAGARAVAWRYVVRNAHQPLATVDAASTGAGDAHSFSHLNQGPFVEATAESVARAGELPEARAAAFEARLLEIPALHSISLWLHGAGKAADLIIPLAPTAPGLEGGRAYPAEAFLDVMEHLAATIDDGEGQSGDIVS